MVQQSQSNIKFVLREYHSIMQRVAANSDDLNARMSTYFEQGDVGLIPGVLILLGANLAFRGKYLAKYISQLKLDGFIDHIPDVSAYFINTNLESLI